MAHLIDSAITFASAKATATKALKDLPPAPLIAAPMAISASDAFALAAAVTALAFERLNSD